MIDKKSGRVSYAVLSFGGFLGIGDDHYPLPRQSFKYDTALWRLSHRHYRDAAEGSAEIRQHNAWNWSDPARIRSVNDYYGVVILEPKRPASCGPYQQTPAYLFQQTPAYLFPQSVMQSGFLTSGRGSPTNMPRFGILIALSVLASSVASAGSKPFILRI
jgi:hypothetical protein